MQEPESRGSCSGVRGRWAEVTARLRPLPVATVLLCAVAAAGNLWQLLEPGVLEGLRRDPGAMAAGAWWRAGTALLVNDGGVVGMVFDLVMLAQVGGVAERWFGWRRWLALAAAGWLAGEVAGYLLGVPGAGTSVASCGLAGGVAVALLRGHTRGATAAAATVVAWLVLAVAASELAGPLVAAVLSALVIPAAQAVRARGQLEPAAGALVLLCGSR